MYYRKNDPTSTGFTVPRNFKYEFPDYLTMFTSNSVIEATGSL